MKNRFDIIEKDLRLIEMEMCDIPDEDLTEEEEVLNSFLMQHANLIELPPLSDEDVDQLWNTSIDEKLPIQLNVKVKKIIKKHAHNEKSSELSGYVHHSFAVAFRKDGDMPEEEQEQVFGAIKKARERLKKKGDKS